MGSILSSSSSSQQEWQATSKNVLITGASNGIGAELARQFASEGANLALLARSKDKLEEVKNECTKLGSPRVETYICDLTNNEQIEKSTQSAIKDFDANTFDVVILNAGRSQGCYFEEIQDNAQIDYMLKLNVNGVITTLHYLLPSIKKSSSSRIVFISSVAGLIGVPYRSIYCASKHALNGFANSLRIELMDTHGIDKSPVISIINFPEVSGTALNSGRMDFGASKPPAEFITNDKSNNRLLTVKEACSKLMIQIANGTRQWGEPMKLTLLKHFYDIIPTILDRMILKTVKETHYRPISYNSKSRQ